MSVTTTDFAKAVLSGIGVPTSSNNVNAMLAWMTFEGGHWHNSAAHNPLNTTQSMPGSYKAPGTIVQAYPDWKTGLAATIKTLNYGVYSGIRAALEQNANPADTLLAIKVSPWGTTAINPTAWQYLAASALKEPAASGSLGWFTWARAAAAGLFLGVVGWAAWKR